MSRLEQLNCRNGPGLAAPFRSMPHLEYIPRFVSGQDRPLDLSLGALRGGPQCQPIDLRRRRRGTVVERVPRARVVRRAWHQVRLNRSINPQPLYSPQETCACFKETFILQKESATEIESTPSITPTVPPAASKAQNNLFGGTTHCPRGEKVAGSNTAYASPLGNPFKKTGDASPEPGNKNILAPSKLSGFANSSTGTNFVFGSCVMKPSSFSSLSSKPQMETFTLKPSVLSNSLSSNPFKKNKVKEGADEEATSTDKTETKNGTQPKEAERESLSEKKAESATLKDNGEQSDQPSLFVPLSSQSESIKSSNDSLQSNGVSSTSQSGFIFGQNLLSKSTDQSRKGGLFTTDSTEGENKSENLFCKAVSVLPTDRIPQEDWTSGKSLVETSRELTEREQNQKRKYDEVEVVTGEEEESNVIQMLCKLYSWTAGCWQERGRGILRLNDKAVNKELFSRLVVRTQGTLTIMLNTKIWAEMSVEKVNDKSVRFTACDSDGQPKIFLVMGAPKDVEILYTSLDYRIFEAKQQHLKIQNSDDETA